MKERQDFDLLGSPLPLGTTLIEASAGTGKTYTIAGLVLRLIIEEDLAIDQILVTTYTELATAELRTRIRELVRESLAFFETGTVSNEAFAPLLERHRDNSATAKRLLLALQTFDEAPIYTIHGFCQRMLQDRAFESGTLFDADLISDQSQILREIVDDFWRANFYVDDPIVALFAERNKLTPAKLFADIQELTNKPTLLIEPVLGDGSLRRPFIALWKEIRACWAKSAHEVEGIFADLSWAKYTHGDPVKMAAYLVNLKDSLSAAGGTVSQLDCLEIFSARKIKKNTRAGHAPRKHRLFEYCEELLAAEPALVVALEAEFMAWARMEMKRRKVQQNVLFFDDLLVRLRDSLGGEDGATLARAIRERLPAALIDEFQDTDPIQYAIFRQIYGADGGRVFYIGDPKQAIYGFRGADVFTYLAAASGASHEWTLRQNWRSETKLVCATNTLFDRPDAFVLEGISFRPVEAAGKADSSPLVVNGVQEPPFHLWLAPDEEPISNGHARQRLPRSVATEIARLLNSEARLGPRPLEPRDIAVLVSTNLEAQIVQEALNDLRIPSVIYGSANVFRSREADELERILAAVAEPAHEQSVRAALATDALGLTAEELDELGRKEREWERRLFQFQEYHQTWSQRGFMQMIRSLLLTEGVRSRLLGYPDGERRLTNMLHLTELLHGLCCESRLGMSGLRKRLAEEIKTAEVTHVEEHELRLERDERAVRVVTIHKSKGLEFGIVFCPFSWGGGGPAKDRHAVFHDGENLVMDLADSEESRQNEAEERLADNVRRLYVALTRARHRSYFVWGNFKNADLSAPAHLLGNWPSPGMEALSEDSGIVTSIIPVESANTYRPAEEAEVSLRPRAFDRVLDRTYGIASFTRLITGQTREPELSEDDAAEAAESELSAPPLELPQTGIFAFPRGTEPGTCLHYIFQELDFHDRTNLAELVGRKLRVFSITGFDEIVCEMIEKVCAVSLIPDAPEFSLADVSQAKRLTELEFYFPIEEIVRERLSDLIGDDRLRFQPMSGFMKGFIDLVFQHQGKFYIVDWKSNWLGPDLRSYTHSEMAIEMEKKFYSLQLSIYTVALHRFLSARLPGYEYDRHFGGAYYIFLRGVEPTEPNHGVFRVHPDATFIDQLSQLLSHGR
ncbi:MAG: exodeoxyribonuclease V subunit beta [Chthoniobacterales bacterium]|nr:exodeoxyribonuclease V subunit beta [Chthoniobacterales bacterium]